MKKNNTKTATKGYFDGITELQTLRETYLKLIKANHPDNGGKTEVCQKINAEYQTAFAKLKRAVHINNIQDEKERKAAKTKWNEETDEAIRDILWKIVGIQGINIEVVGCWIWVDGETYGVKDKLKAEGFQWSKARKKWHMTPYKNTEWKRYGKKESFETIEHRYGAEHIQNEDKRVLN